MHDTSLLQQVTLFNTGSNILESMNSAIRKFFLSCFVQAAIDNLLPSRSGDLIFYIVVTGYCVIKMPIKSIVIYLKIMKNTFLFKIN